MTASVLATAPRPPATGKVPPLPDHLSPSAIKEYLTCPLKYYFGRIAHIEKFVPANLHVGKAVHEAIRFFNLATWRGEDASKDRVLGKYDELYITLEESEGPVEYKNVEHRDAIKQMGFNLVETFLESDAAALTDKPRGVEVRVRERFDESPVPILGIIDYVRPGNIPVDYKTIGSSPNLNNETWGHQIQLTAYQLLTERATGERVTGTELVFLVKNKKPKVIRHVIAPANAAQIARFWTMVAAVINGLQEGRFHPQPGMHCSWCQYRAECAKFKGHTV